MSNIKTSVVRTVTPVVAGIILSVAVRAGLDRYVTPALAEDIGGDIVTVVVTSVYYWVVRVLETARSSRWGWLLGSPAQVTYAKWPPPPLP